MTNVIQLSTVRPRRTAEIEATAGAIVATMHRMPTEPI
jgi:hypothetical protein